MLGEFIGSDPHSLSTLGTVTQLSGLGMLLSLLQSCLLHWHLFPQAPALLCAGLETAVLKTSSKSSAEQIALCKSRLKVLGFVRAQRKVLDWIFKPLSVVPGVRG